LWLTPGEQAGKTRDIATGQLAVGGGHAISATGGDLVIATPTGAQYLGYDLESPAIAQPAGDGRLVIGLGATFLALDAQLRAAGSLGVAMPEGAQVSDLRWLGGDAWVVEASRPDDTRSSLLLVAGGATKVVRKDLAVAHLLAYEPSTQLVTLSLGDAPSVYKFDPGTRELSRVAVVADAGAYAQNELIPLAPARAGGAQLLHVTLRDTTTLEWLPDATKLGKPSAKVTFTGSIAAADASGHAYGWVTTADTLELAVFSDGKRLRSLPADEPVSVWPDATGAHVAVIGTHGVSLVTGDGKRAWTKQLEHATEALWLSDGALAVITAAGIARIETATGAVTAARCGWGFGLAAMPHPPPSRVESVCAQLEPGD